MRFLIINGPNLGILGHREPDVYGTTTYDELRVRLDAFARAHGSTARFVQSDSEGELIGAIHAATGSADAIIMNAGAYTHTSYAIHDALRAISVPAIEVHISNIYARESFRSVSVTASACRGQICGLGIFGYEVAMLAFLTNEAH